MKIFFQGKLQKTYKTQTFKECTKILCLDQSQNIKSLFEINLSIYINRQIIHKVKITKINNVTIRFITEIYQFCIFLQKNIKFQDIQHIFNIFTQESIFEQKFMKIVYRDQITNCQLILTMKHNVFLHSYINKFLQDYKFTTFMNKKKESKAQPFITFGPNNHQQDNYIEIQQKNQYSSSTQEKLDQSKNDQPNSLKKQTNHEDNINILSKIPISPIQALIQPKQISLSSFGISCDMTALLIQDKIQIMNEEHRQSIVLTKNENKNHIHQQNFTIQHLGCCNIFYKKNWHFKQLAIKIQDNKHPLLCMQQNQLPIDNLVKAKIILNQEGQQSKEGLIKLTFQKQQSEKEKKQEEIIFISAKRSRQRGIITDQFSVFANIVYYKLIGSNVANSDWNKTPHIDNNIILNSYMFGNIYKKGQIRDQWNSRYAVIRDDGFYSFHTNTDSKYSFKIQAKDIKQIWTRFDQIYDSIIFKVRHGLSKTELALPICKYSKDQCSNWLLQLYRIANKTF